MALQLVRYLQLPSSNRNPSLRVSTLNKLKSHCDSASDDKDLIHIGRLFESLLAETDPMVLDMTLKLLQSFLDASVRVGASDDVVSRYANVICKPLTSHLRGGGDQVILKAATQAFLSWLEMGAMDAFMESIAEALKDYSLAVNTLYLMILSLRCRGVEIPTLATRMIMLMPEQIESGRPVTVDYAFKLAHEIVKVIGAQTFKEKYFEHLRVIKEQELDDGLRFVENSLEPVTIEPSIHDVMESPVHDVGTSLHVPHSGEEQRDVISFLEESKFWTNIDNRSSIVRKGAISRVRAVASNRHRFRAGDLSRLYASLNQVITADTTLEVAIEAVLAIGDIASVFGVQSPNCTSIFGDLINKFKVEGLRASLIETLEAVHKAGSINLLNPLIVDAVTAGIRDEDPDMRLSLLTGIHTLIEKIAASDITETYAQLLAELLLDDDKRVRDTAENVLKAHSPKEKAKKPRRSWSGKRGKSWPGSCISR